MSLMRYSSAPRACPGEMGEVSSSLVSKEGWMEGAGQKETMDGLQRGDLSDEEHGRGGDG